MANLYPYALTTSLSTSKELKTEDGTTVQVFPQQVGGLAVNVTLTGPDVTGRAQRAPFPQTSLSSSQRCLVATPQRLAARVSIRFSLKDPHRP